MEYANETIRFKMIKIKQTLLHKHKWEKQDSEQGLFESEMKTIKHHKSGAYSRTRVFKRL